MYYVLNMCRWDWFDDGSDSMKDRRRRERSKQKQQALLLQLEQQNAPASAEAADDDHSMEDAKPSATENGCARITRSRARAALEQADGQEEDLDTEEDDDGMEEEDVDFDEEEEVETEEGDDDSDEWSDGEDQYHAANRRQFSFHDVDSDDEDREAASGGPAENQRSDWIRRQFARIHVLRALASMEDQAVDVAEG